jgi:hypothetical protein
MSRGSRSDNSRNGSGLREMKFLWIPRWGTGIACRKVLRERRGIVLVCGASELELEWFWNGARRYSRAACRQHFG